MRCRNKPKGMRVVLRLAVGLMMGLFVLGTSNAKNVEGFNSHKRGFWKAKPVTCGTVLQDGYYELTGDLTCSDNPAIEIAGPAKLNLKGYTLSGDNGANNGIVITGNGAKVWNGTVTRCDYGIRVRGDFNEIIRVEARDNFSRGIRIDGGENVVIKCFAAQNANQGIVIKGDDNKIFSCKVHDNCRDGIEIDGGNNNLVFSNHVEDNGNAQTCEGFKVAYQPWYYAGIDVTYGSNENEIKGNRACGNRGCVGTDCIAVERDFWDENVDVSGQCDSTNRWKHNSIMCTNVAPECNAAP